MENFYDDITVCLKSFMRSKKTRECFASWQKHYPGLKFIIVDDGPIDDVHSAFYGQIEAGGHKVIRTEFDIGLSAGRNVAMEQVKTKYVLMIDNDHFATETTNLYHLYEILRVKRYISIVGGRIFEDVKEGDKYPRYEGWLNIDTNSDGDRMLRYEKLDMNKHKWEEFDDIQFANVEITHNFLLMRRAIYPTLKWDESIKVCGDHTDFFLEFKAKGYKMAFVPSAVVWHNYPQLAEDENPEYDKYRGRIWYLNVFGKKWGLDLAKDFWNRLHIYDYNK